MQEVEAEEETIKDSIEKRINEEKKEILRQNNERSLLLEIARNSLSKKLKMRLPK